MLAVKLHALLIAYEPMGEEIEYKRIILDFLQSNQNAFERSNAGGHITASSWLLNKNLTHALLMHHKKLDRWFQLGGHCDGNRDTMEVALKESREESGINGIEPINQEIFDIDIHWIPSNPKEAGHYHYDIRYLLKVNSDEQIVKNSESKELRWIPVDGEYPTDNASVNRMFDKYKNKSPQGTK